MISTNRRNNGVLAFFYPITNIIGGQNSGFKKSGGRLTWSLTPFAAESLLRFLRLFTWRSGRGRFGWSLNRIGADA